MTNPIIGYENTFADATITASSDPAATPKENALNWQLFNYWQPSPTASFYLDFDFGTSRSCDYLAFYSSDLYTYTNARVIVYSSSSLPVTGGGQRANVLINTAGPKLLQINDQVVRYYRVEFQTASAVAPKIQSVVLGNKLELQRGIRPSFKAPALGNYNRPYNSVSEGGILLGRSNKIEPVKFSLSTDMLTPSWVRSNWPAFLAHAEKYPFFLLPEPDSYTDEAVYCWTDGEIMPPMYQQSNLMSLSLKLHAYR